MRSCLLFSAILLTACATAGAEPERYAGMDCQQLSDLKRSYDKSLTKSDPFIDSDINDRIRSDGASRNVFWDIGESKPGLTPGQVEQEKDLNSIRAASRLKGC